MEAENGTYAGFGNIPVVSGSSGRRYIITVRANAAIFWDIKPPAAGKYYVWFRGAAPSAASDTVAVWANGIKQTYQFGAGAYSAAWQWSVLNQPGANGGLVLRVLDLLAGPQRLVLTSDEVGFRLDGLLITNDPTFVPNDSIPQIKIP
jgi:hypothetical protein